MKRNRVKAKKEKFPAIIGGKPLFSQPIPITKPTIPPITELKKRYETVLKSGMITNYKFVQEFEEKVAKYLGVSQAIAVSSCTSGLMLILRSMGLKGEVILPSFTFHATAHAVAWNGLIPVFADCDPETYNLLPEAVEQAITPRTCAVIGVHIFGNPADIDSLEKIAKAHKLKLIFDAAHGFGTKYKGKNVGSFGGAESFSLSPTKLLTCGEGGIVATDDEELAKKIKIGRNYGDPGDYDCQFSGLSARMSEFNAILGIESLKILEKNVSRRNSIAKMYQKLLSDIPGIGFQKIREDNRSSYKDFSVLIDEKKFGLSRDRLAEAMLAENIVVKKYFYPPVHQQKAFKVFGLAENGNLKNTLIVSFNSLSLPLYSHIKEEDVNNICLVLKRIYQHSDEIRNVLSKPRL